MSEPDSGLCLKKVKPSNGDVEMTTKQIIEPDHPLFDLAVKFHSGQITDPVERQQAKDQLFLLHYSNNTDLSQVFLVAKTEKKKQELR